MSKYLRRNKGFSLLELIISVAILSIGIISIIQAISYSTRVTGLSCDMITASFLAKDIVQELEFKERQGALSSQPLAYGEKKGKFTISYSLSPHQDLNLYVLDFDIAWKRLTRQEEVKLNTYLLR